MIKKLATPIILELQWACLGLYFWRMSHDPKQIYWNNYQWTVFYDTSIMLPFILLSAVFAFTREKERSIFDTQFLIIGSVFMLILNIAIIMQGYGLINHTYGYQIAIIAIILLTFIIIISAYRHEFYKN